MLHSLTIASLNILFCLTLFIFFKSNNANAVIQIPIEYSEKNARKEFMLGNKLFQKNKVRKALTHYLSAVKSAPDIFVSYKNTIVVALKLKDCSTAISAEKGLKKLKPKIVLPKAVRINLEKCKRKNNKNSSSLKTFGSILLMNLPPGQVFLNNTAFEISRVDPWQQIVMPTGLNEIQIESKGYTPQVLQVDVQLASTVTLDLTFEEIKTTKASPSIQSNKKITATPHAKPSISTESAMPAEAGVSLNMQKPSALDAVTIAALGGGLAAIATGVYFNTQFSNTAWKIKENPAGSSQESSLQNKYTNQRNLSMMSYGLGTAAIGVGIWRWVKQSNPMKTINSEYSLMLDVGATTVSARGTF